LGADTVVVVDGVVLGKPSGPEEARGMLVRLRGRWHEVITGVAVVDAGTERGASATAVSRVLMADYSDATVEAYVASGSPFDKAVRQLERARGREPGLEIGELAYVAGREPIRQVSRVGRVDPLLGFSERARDGGQLSLRRAPVGPGEDGGVHRGRPEQRGRGA